MRINKDFFKKQNFFEFEIHLVDHCNLQCASCNHFSCVAEPWFIDKIDFCNTLSLLLNKIKNIKRLMLLGGEPTLHPNFIEICIEARNILGDKPIIQFLTNGVGLENKPDEWWSALRDKEIEIYLSVYPIEGNKYSEVFKKIEKFYGKEYLLNMLIGKQRIAQNSVILDVKGRQNYTEQFNNCGNYNIPCFTIRDNKIFVCPMAANIHILNDAFGVNISLEDTDYLNLSSIQDIEDLNNFAITPKKICRYCKNITEPFLWHQSSKTLEEYTVPCSERAKRDSSTAYLLKYNPMPYNILKALEIHGVSFLSEQFIDVAYNRDFLSNYYKQVKAYE